MANLNLIASDDFSSGSLAAGWTNIPTISVCQVVNVPPHVTEPNATGTAAGQMWNALGVLGDQISEVTINALTSELASNVVMACRVQSGGSFSGYVAVYGNSQVQLKRYDAGVPTNLGSSVGTLTIRAGDVIALSVCGAALAFYINGKRIQYYYDATYATGYPGYWQQAGTNVNHAQVSSWRGYNPLQQDGIWQKQGINVPTLAGDLNVGMVNTSPIIYEGNAQILSGTVYKMWFSSATGASGNGHCYYAESLDGLTWSRQGTAIINSQVDPLIIKVGSTYYLYTTPPGTTGVGGTGNFTQYSSTDGVTWTQQATNMLGLGGSGAWDESAIYFLQPVTISAGTWYALYTGSSVASPTHFSIGLATSTDGVTWTRYGGNPVLTYVVAGTLLGSVVNSAAIVNIGGTWFMWCEQGQPGRGSANDLDPTETVRYQSTDLIHWTNPVHSIHNTQMYESLNNPNGQAYPNAIIDIGGKAHMYCTCTPSDAAPPHVYQIGLAIGPAPIADIVLFNEDAAPQVASDAFPTPGALSGNWTVPTGAGVPVISSAATVNPTLTATASYACYTGQSFSNDQYSEVTLKTLTASVSDYAFPIVRCATGAKTFYQAVMTATMNMPATISIDKIVAGVESSLSSVPVPGSTFALTPEVGDVIRLSVIGNVLSVYLNGFLVGQIQDYASTIASGNPGIGLFAASNVTHAQISSWAGGNAGVIPTYPTAGQVGAFLVGP
jgi:hypothetical protein